MNTNQLLHISGEIIVLLSFTYFLQKQITKLSKSHSELIKRIDEFEENYNKKYEMLFGIVENLDRQLQMSSMSSINSMSSNPYFSVHNPATEFANLGLRNRRSKQQPTPNENFEVSSEPMRLNKNYHPVPSQHSQQPQQQSQQQPLQPQPQQPQPQQSQQQSQHLQMSNMPNMSSMPSMPTMGFNPLDLLNSISNISNLPGMNSPPVFSATIVTENIIPKKPDSQVKIVEVEEEDDEVLDEEIADELKDLLSEADKQSENNSKE